jgi:hypothetical protein
MNGELVGTFYGFCFYCLCLYLCATLPPFVWLLQTERLANQPSTTLSCTKFLIPQVEN